MLGMNRITICKSQKMPGSRKCSKNAAFKCLSSFWVDYLSAEDYII